MVKPNPNIEGQSDYEWRLDVKNSRCLNCSSKHLKGHWVANLDKLKINRDVWIQDDEYFCEQCYNHLSDGEKDKLINDFFEKIAKPWQDSESLFCDTKFLKELIGKEPTKGTECKDEVIL